MSEAPIAGRYTELERIGTGATASVYRARDLTDDRHVALKLISGVTPAAVARLDREAQALASLEHASIVRYIDHGTTATGELYLAMEWVAGESLAARLERGPLGVDDTVTLGRRLAAALSAAHDRGIVHRDLKPLNIVLVGGDVAQPKIIDFGLAKLAGADTLTLTGTILGTPAYMAPEQARGDLAITERADVFALACVLHHCLAGAPPFEGEHAWAVLAKVLLAPAPPLREHAPPALEALLALALDKEASRRPVAAAFAIALDDLALAPSRSQPDLSITVREKRLVSVVVLHDDEATTIAHADTMVDARAPSRVVELAHEITRPYVADVERLAGGQVIVVLRGEGVASDLASIAARCALALRDRLPRARVVLATGAAVVAGRLPVGEIIDRAAILLAREVPQVDGVRPILVDQVTAGLLDARFALGQVGADVVLHRLRHGAAPVRTLLGRATPFVGREREMLTLEALYAEVADESVARAVHVSGPPGSGKSRLRHELLLRLRERDPAPLVWIGRGDPISAGSPFGLAAHALRAAFDLAEGRPLDHLRAQVRAEIARAVAGADAPRVAAFLGELIGVPFDVGDDAALGPARRDPVLMGDLVRAAFEHYLAGCTRDRPVVVVLEDLHWGDVPTVRMLEAAIRALADQPLLVVSLGRDEVATRFPSLWRGVGGLHVTLGELSRRACDRLVRNVLPDARADAVALILERAGGNALLLEELTRGVAEGWSELPGSVIAVLQARLESLDAEARRVLRAASVFGGAAWRGGMRHLTGDARALVDSWLPRLVDRELLTRRETSRFAGDEEYVFRHALLRDATYATLTDADRAVGHRLAGEWLEAHGEVDPMLLAAHFDRGGRADRACHWYQRAALEALSGYDYEAVHDRVARGLGFAADPESRGRLHALAAQAYRWSADNARATVSYRAAIDELLPSSDDWLAAVSDLVVVTSLAGEVDTAETMARLLLANPPPFESTAWITACSKVAARLLIAEREALARELLARLDDVIPEDTVARAWLARARGLAAMSGGDLTTAATFLEASAAAFHAVGDSRNAATQQLNRVEVLGWLGLVDEAMAILDALAPEVARMSRSVWWHTLSAKAMVLVTAGRYDLAAALEIDGHELRSTRLLGLLLVDVAEAHRRLGGFDRAEQLLAIAAEHLAEYPSLLATASAVAALVLLDRGQPAAALARLPPAGVADTIDSRPALVALAQVRGLAAAGRADQARERAERSRAALDARAAAITDPALRARFLAVPLHRELLALADAVRS